MERRKSGFTMMELLTVVAIIALLITVLIPSVTMVRRVAKETKQRVQLTAIDLALTAFKGDYGDYPPSDRKQPPYDNYCGAQKLAEALVGWDLLGFHPDSAWRADGWGNSGKDETYDPDKAKGTPRDADNDGVPDTLNERRGPYLEPEAANAFMLKDLFKSGQMGPLEGDTFVICDVFAIKKITRKLTSGKIVRFKAGTPILYYRANTSSKRIGTGPPYDEQIYNVLDNVPFTTIIPLLIKGKPDPLGEQTGNYKAFYDFIEDPKTSTDNLKRPYRPDSYILITAGADGLYGTEDDICNF